MKHKQDIHKEVDHPGLKDIRQAFDIRSWTIDIKDDDAKDEKERKIDEFLAMMQLKFVDEDEELNDFGIGEDIKTLFESYSACVRFVIQKNMLSSIKQINCIRAQWTDILHNPLMNQHIAISNFVDRLKLHQNAEA